MRAVLLAAALAGATGQAAMVRGAAGPAADSLRSLPRYEVKEPTRSTADAMSLHEIIARCTEGERTKLAGHRDMTYTASLRATLTWKNRREVVESGYLGYEEEGGFQRLIRLGERRRKYRREGDGWAPAGAGRDEGSLEVGVSADAGGEGLARLPFFLKDQHEYEFTLLERTLEGDHVIFRIGFRPRSEFKPLPSGTVYVDTDAYRIIHEEFTFDNANPFPLLLQEVRRVSREWRRLTTGEWVVGSIRADVALRGGWTGAIPERFEMGLRFDDYRFDQGYDEARFGGR